MNVRYQSVAALTARLQGRGIYAGTRREVLIVGIGALTDSEEAALILHFAPSRIRDLDPLDKPYVGDRPFAKQVTVNFLQTKPTLSADTNRAFLLLRADIQTWPDLLLFTIKQVEYLKVEPSISVTESNDFLYYENGREDTVEEIVRSLRNNAELQSV